LFEAQINVAVSAATRHVFKEVGVLVREAHSLVRRFEDTEVPPSLSLKEILAVTVTARPSFLQLGNSPVLLASSDYPWDQKTRLRKSKLFVILAECIFGQRCVLLRFISKVYIFVGPKI
jgi:hypothetical protein